MSNKREFVCQNCGKTVPASRGKCPHCGRFFKGVRCPKCFYVGESDDFLKGCPSCGYLEDEMNNANSSEAKKKDKNSSRLPLWFLLLSSGFLVIIIIIIINIFLRM
ncbi:MAG: hypothetical protein FWD87_04805 [Spirochaetaceae bacterium]|nr:hypothetical protein [Spirochaetaceae bacterium]